MVQAPLILNHRRSVRAGGFPSQTAGDDRTASSLSATAAAADFSAHFLRNIVAVFERDQVERISRELVAAKRRSEELIRTLLSEPFTDLEWQQLKVGAQAAARRGETQIVIMLFPAKLCSDGGRRINLPAPDWPASLRGKAARFYTRWREELQPQGFSLQARICNFPNGMPGDVELILAWA